MTHFDARLRLFGLALFVAGAGSVWVVLGVALADWVEGATIRIPFTRVWIIGLAGGLSAVSGAIVFVRLTVAAVDSERNPPPAPRCRDDAARRWCVWLHASALGGYIIPFAHIALPVTIWLAKRQLDPCIDVNARIVLNFQIATTLFALVGLLLSVLVIGFVVMAAAAAWHATVTIRATYRAARGALPGYPFTLDVFR